MKLNIILIILSVFTFIGCEEAVLNAPILKVKTIPKDGFIINKWQIIGPLISQNQETSIDSNHIACFGFKEKEITYKDFVKLSKDSIENNCKLDSLFENNYIITGETPLEFEKILEKSDDKTTGSYYLGCIIKCKDSLSTRLHFSTNKKAKIWINNKLFLESNYSLPFKAYRNFKPVTLKKGDNFLLIKIQNPDKYTEVYARLENESKGALERFYSLRNHSILEWDVYLYADSIKLDPRFPSVNGTIKILDKNKSIVINDSIYNNTKWSRPVSVLNKGEYLVKTTIGDIELIQKIYRGDIVDTIKKTFNKIQNFQVSEKIKRNINALNFRFSQLQKSSWWGDKNHIDIYNQVKNIHQKLKNDENPFSHTKGSFLRSYVSKIDSSEQFYMLHVPSSYKETSPIPISIIVPVNISGNKPYLESYYRVKNIELSNLFQDLAEKYNIILIEYGARRNEETNHNSIEDTELFSIINDIEKDYNIDRNSIHLAGTCSGSNELIKLAIKYPDVFASIGMVSPSISYVPENTNPWVESNSPIRFISNIKNLPIFNIHSIIDRHVPIETSENLEKLADYFHIDNFHYTKVTNHYPKYDVDYYFKNIIEFNKKHKLNKSPKEMNFTTNQMLYNKSFWITIKDMKIPGEANIKANITNNKLVIEKKNITAYDIDTRTIPFNKEKPLKIVDNNKVVYNSIVKDSVIHIKLKKDIGLLKKDNHIAGPLAHIFANRFLFVKGTIGNDSETKAITNMANKFNKHWQERYFVDCMIKNDIDVTKTDIETSNIILLGNPNSNLWFNKLSKTFPSLPLEILNSKITLRNKEVKGNNLGVYMIYPSPFNTNKYIAVIGFNNSDFATLGSEIYEFNDVSNYGWYDYKVWDNRTGRTIEKGYFNSSWK